ncbi:hypothetical protein nvc1_109 [Namao virus]|nr:hypothetical protein nvc1_109 [Namao virus]
MQRVILLLCILSVCGLSIATTDSPVNSVTEDDKYNNVNSSGDGDDYSNYNISDTEYTVFDTTVTYLNPSYKSGSGSDNGKKVFSSSDTDTYILIWILVVLVILIIIVIILLIITIKKYYCTK